MFLFFILLIIAQILTGHGDFVEEKKFINNLKEDAKKEFIDRVVRRLAEEVDLKGVPTEKSRTIPDDQLDTQNDLVKKIINEEKATFEKESHHELQDKQAASELRRQSNYSHIDFTLREQSRKKRHENNVSNDNKVTTEVNEVTIPVQIVYDVDSNKGADRTANDSSPVEKDDIQVKGQRPKLRRSAQKEDKDLDVKSDNETTSNKSTDLGKSNVNQEKLVPFDKSKDSNEVKSSVTEASEEVTPTIVSLENNYESVETTTKIAVEEDQTSEKPKEVQVESTTIDNGKLSDQNKVLTDFKKDSISSDKDYLKDSDSARVTPEVTESDITSEHIVNTTLAKNVEVRENVAQKQALRNESLVQKTETREHNEKEVELNTHLTTTSTPESTETTTIKAQITVLNVNITNDKVKENRINDLTLTYNPYKTEHVAENHTSNLRGEKVKIVKVGPSSKNILRSRIATVKIINTLDRRKSTEVNDELKTLEIAEDIMKALRKGIERDTKNKKPTLRKKPNLKRNKVNIYGLRSFDEDKSIEKDVINKEEPYYAPVYNYDPNNAYYNAYNKFGPNYEDSKEANEPSIIRYADSLNLPSEKLSRSFFKKPIKANKKVLSRKPKIKYVYNEKILPFIVKTPFILPQDDYEEIFETNYIRENNDIRSGYEIKETDESLKNHLRQIRNSVHSLIGKNQNVNNVKENRGTGWLDEGVTYYFENLKNIAKPRKHPKGYQSINYDYMGDVRLDKNNKLRSMYKVPTATPHPINTSREVITRIKKGKSRSDSKELLESFQKVFPLLKNLVQIIDDDVDEEVEACIKVLKDMIDRNEEGLEQYDWLESTVNIQSAIGKLLDLTRAAIEELEKHPSDIELLKFTTYLFSVATENVQYGAEIPNARSRSLKSRTARGHFVNHKKLLADSNKSLYRVPTPSNSYKFEYGRLRRFLNDLSDSLFDLHDALKHVSLVTRFKSQRWYGNLKDIYLHDPNRKKLLQVILHLGTTRLFNLIEDTSKNGVEEDFTRYISENQTMVSVVRDAFVFVLKVLQAAMYST